MDRETQDKLRDMLNQHKMDPFIKHIRFPFYKNLSEYSQIDFTFPITALVGQNGTNKSSVLKALYGAPQGYSLGNLWFSTKIDPIEDGGRSRFIYGYYDHDSKQVVEVIKSRIKQKDDPDYWEPARPSTNDGMKLFDPSIKSRNKSKTRWNAISKKVVYFDFRAQLSAFDKCFYHSDVFVKNSDKKNHLRARSRLLRDAVDNNLQDYSYYGIERIKQNSYLPDIEVNIVSEILGREYDSIQIIQHSFFNKSTSNFTVILKTSNLHYSEAFAGSGEFAIVMLVHHVMSSDDFSLLLLDEPEVSLHPAAQNRLMEFLFKQCFKKKLQIVLSTHSSTIIKSLPRDAIKLFHINQASNKVDILNDISANEAFFYLGDKIEKRTVIVEDSLAKEVIRKALRSDNALLSQFDIKFVPGGAEAIIKNHIAPFSIAKMKKAIFLLDGDKNKGIPFEQSNTIPESQNNLLTHKLKEIFGCSIKLPIDGNSGTSNKENQYQEQRNFIDYTYNYVSFLPMNTPEEFILNNLSGDYKEMLDKIDISIDDKNKFVELCKLDLDEIDSCSSNDILNTQKRIVSRMDNNLSEFNEIRMLFKKFIDDGKIR